MELVSDAAIVTGAAQGIGRGIAEELARLGTSIAIADVDVAEAASTAGDRDTPAKRGLESAAEGNQETAAD